MGKHEAGACQADFEIDTELGAPLKIGAASFRVTQVLDYRPDQGTGFVNLAPAALLNFDDVPSTADLCARLVREYRDALKETCADLG